MTSPASRPRIVFLDASTLALDLQPLADRGELTAHDITSPGLRAERVSTAEVIVSNKVVLDADTIAAAPDLKLILVAATGVDNIDLDAARARSIPVCNVSGYSTDTVAQHVFSLLLNLTTNCHRYAAEAPLWARSPIFTRLDHPVVELAGRRLGIVGLGRIGMRVAEIGRALGMEVRGLAREGSSTTADGVPRLQLDELLASCDAISLHCPLTDSTRHLINTDALASMKPGAFLINTGRGALIEEAALAAALRERRLGGAGLDVLSQEPPPADHPLLDPSLPNLIITPHTAWSSIEARTRLLQELVGNLDAWLADEPRNRVA